MNVFSSDPFLETAAEVYFPNQLAEIIDVQLNSHFYRTLLIDKTKLIGAVPFMEWLEPVPQEKMGKYAQICGTYLPNVYVETLSLNEWNQKKTTPGLRAAPFVDMSAFNSFDELKDTCRRFKRQAFGQSTRRSINKLKKNFGSVEFEPNCPTEQAKIGLDLLAQWKKGQFERANLINVFVQKKNRLFLTRLIDKKLLKIASLIIDSQPIAIVAYFLWESRLTYLLCGYDPKYAAYRPGTISLEKLLEHSYEWGYQEFDLCEGDMPYKFGYCDQLRVIRPGCKPNTTRFFSSKLNQTAISNLRKIPFLFNPLKKIVNMRRERNGVRIKYGQS